MMNRYIYLIPVLFTIVSCSNSIRLTGAGAGVPMQEGLKIELQAIPSSVQISIKNTTQGIVTLFKRARFVHVLVTVDGESINPDYPIKHKESIHPSSDDFLLIGPGQTVIMPIRLNSSGNRMETYTGTYIFQKNKVYDIQVKLYPYDSAKFKNYIRYSWPNLIITQIYTNTLSYKL